VEEIKHRASLNLGGNSEIYVTRYTNVVKIPRVVDGAIVGDLIVSAIWHPIEFLAYSLDYDESTDDDRSGDKVKVTIDFIIAQETKEVKRLLRLLRQERLAVIIKDLSLNQYRLIGGKHEFLSHSKDFKTGSNPANRNQNAVRLQGLVKDSYLYEGIILIAPPLAPINLVAVGFSDTQINLTWQDLSNVETGFELQISTDGGNWMQEAILGIDASSYIDTDLITGTNYRYMIRAISNSVLGPWSEVVSLKTFALLTWIDTTNLTWVDASNLTFPE
jgi:hypothetical protein